jgi:hypothetical protein
MDRFVRAEWHVDFGERGRLEAELEKSRLWLALPPPLDAEVWIKGVGEKQDFRILLTRTKDGLEITLDRGPGGSWPDGIPKLGVTLDNSAGRGVAYVGIGDRRNFSRGFLL